MKNIVHICLNGIVTDGFSYQDNLLPKYHKRLGYNVFIITNEFVYDKTSIVKTTNVNYVNDDGVSIIRIPTKGNKDFSCKFKKYVDLYSTIEKCKPDILFVHGVNFCDLHIIKKYVQNNKCVLYIDNHCDESNSGTNWISLNILHKFFWRKKALSILPYVKMFYGVQPVRVEWLRNVYKIPANKTKLLVMGADDDFVEVDIKEIDNIKSDYEIGKDDFIIITGGKIDSKKRQILYLMETINELENSNVKLLVFGKPTKELEEEFNSLLSEKVKCVGWINNEKSYKLFATANLGCFPGRHSVYWEQCVAQGLPLLCNNLKGIEHLNIGKNIMLKDLSTKENMKHYIKLIIENPAIYNEMKESAINDGRKKFLYSEIAKDSLK